MIITFGEYTADRNARTVTGPSGACALSTRAYGILMALIGRPGEVISKDELFSAAWPGSAVVEENTLQVHVSSLRKALPPDYIVTVHGRGYRYGGPVPVLSSSSAFTPAEPVKKPAIAVLPFSNLSGDPGQPSSFACYEWILRGNWHLNKITRADTALAVGRYEKALALEPRNGEALSLLAACRSSMWLFDLDRRLLGDAIALANRGCEADPDHAFCHAVMGLAQCWTDGLDAGGAALDRALHLNPLDWRTLGTWRSMRRFPASPSGRGRWWSR